MEQAENQATSSPACSVLFMPSLSSYFLSMSYMQGSVLGHPKSFVNIVHMGTASPIQDHLSSLGSSGD